MGNLLKYGLVIAAVGYFFYASQSTDREYVAEENDTQSVASVDEIDLNIVLDITVDTLEAFQQKLDIDKTIEQTAENDDQIFVAFADTLSLNYNDAQPKLIDAHIGVSPQSDSSLLAYSDSNQNFVLDDAEVPLFKIEIDGENARVIASGADGAVNEHHFSGTSLLAGYLIGSMLGRQGRAGVNTNTLANKKPAKAAATSARSRAGSGSHARGK